MNVNDKLLPCPHCGKTETLEFATRRELEDCPNFDDCDAEKCEYGACDYFGTWDCVVCSVIKSGCGATGGYASCPAEAVEKWNTRATVGTLTAEQVREAIKANSWAETSSLLEFNDSSWQAIADELNATLGNDDDYERKMDALLCRLTNGKWSKSRSYSVDFMASCVDEAYEELYEKERATLVNRTTTRHGKFKTKYGRKVPLCECCGYAIGDDRYNYCPKCGAKVVES